jgi:uncharacterized RDD family membrane protein YckC
MSAPAPPDSPPPEPLPETPGLARRLACFVYEGVLLFGVLMIAGIAYSSITQQRHGLVGRTGLQLFVFAILGLYFGWFWTHGGQTVAMKAWHIRVVDLRCAPVSWQRALTRYLLAWGWFAPALGVLSLTPIRSPAAVATILLAGVVTYAGLVWLHPRRQYLHDALAGTQLITWRPPPRR